MFFWLLNPIACANAQVNFGINSPHVALKANKMWSQFFRDLGRDTNTEFTMRVGDPNKSRQDFENSTTSFLITNPKATLTVLERPNAIHVAFINPQWNLVNGGGYYRKIRQRLHCTG